MADALVFAPHMDDEVLGCGALLDEATDPVVVFGCWSRDKGIEVDAVAALLDYRFKVLLPKDMEGQLLSVNRRELVQKLESILHEELPERVFLPSASYHQDHAVMHDAAIAATRPLSREGYTPRLVASYEYPGSAWRQDGMEEGLNYYITYSRARFLPKLDAVGLYKSQQGRAAMDPELVEAWGRLRGSFVGAEYAEAFRILRQVA